MTSRPNVLLVMTDQHRHDLSFLEGSAGMVMPTLRRLADRGTIFEGAHTSYPACVPARVSLLTGRFPSAHQVRQNSNAAHAFFDRDLLDVLHEAGYETFFAGKPHMHRGPDDFDHWSGPYWHTSGPQQTAEQRAFDQWLDDLDHSVSDVATPFSLDCQLPHRIVSNALDDLRTRDRDRPFFAFVSFPEPHNPYQAPEPYFSMFNDIASDFARLAGPEVIAQLSWRHQWLHDLVEAKRPGFDDGWRHYLSVYLGMLRMVDDQIARLFEGLGAALDDTIVIFVADHGDYVGEYGMQRKGAGLPDALVRIPLVIAGPGIAHGVRDELVSITDLMPTLCGLLDQPLPAGVQGRDLSPLLLTGAAFADRAAPDQEFGTIIAELGYGGIAWGAQAKPDLHFDYAGPTFDELNSVTQSGQERMLRRGDLKLVMDEAGRQALYDLASDPAEVHNLVDDPDRAADLAALTTWLARWMMRLGDELPTGVYTPRIPPHNWRWAPEAFDVTTPTDDG